MLDAAHQLFATFYLKVRAEFWTILPDHETFDANVPATSWGLAWFLGLIGEVPHFALREGYTPSLHAVAHEASHAGGEIVVAHGAPTWAQLFDRLWIAAGLSGRWQDWAARAAAALDQNTRWGALPYEIFAELAAAAYTGEEPWFPMYPILIHDGGFVWDAATIARLRAFYLDIQKGVDWTMLADADFVTRCYWLLLGRAPENQGAIDGRVGRPRADVFLEIATSDEALARQKTIGAVVSAPAIAELATLIKLVPPSS